MSILVTGAGGLVGASVSAALTGQGFKVVRSDSQDLHDPSGLTVRHVYPQAHRWHEIIRKYDVDVIVHGGAISGPMLVRDDPELICDVNLRTTLDLLEAARICGIRQLVWFSSIMAYGHHDIAQALDEDSPLRPDTIYGATKAAGEAVIRAYSAQFGLNATILRLASCYSAARTTPCLIRQLVDDGLNGRVTPVAPCPGKSRQFIHIDDVTTVISSILARKLQGFHVFNVGPGRDQSLDEILQAVQVSVPKARTILDEAGFKENTFPVGPLKIQRLEEALSFRPEVDLVAGVHEMVRHLA